MRRAAACLAVLVLAAARAAASTVPPRGLGLGIVAGDPTGITAKHFLDRHWALDAGVGFSGDAAIYADLLFHDWRLLPPPKKGEWGLYGGAGLRLETDDDTAFGIRTIAGLSWLAPGRPLEVFIEAGPVFQLAPDRDVDVDAGIGVRVYFGGGGAGSGGRGGVAPDR